MRILQTLLAITCFFTAIFATAKNSAEAYTDYKIYESRFFFTAVSTDFESKITVRKPNAPRFLIDHTDFKLAELQQTGPEVEKYVGIIERNIHQDCYKFYDKYEVRQEVLLLAQNGSKTTEIKGQLIKSKESYVGNNGRCHFR